MFDMSIFEETFTAEGRYQTCVHEAAHAVIFSIGGEDVQSIEVFDSDQIFNALETEAVGICYVPKLYIGNCVKYDDEQGCYIPDKRLFKSFKRRMEQFCKGLSKIINHRVRT